MANRGKELKELQKRLGLLAKEVADAIPEGSIDTVRQLGRIPMSDEMLDKIETGIETARQKRIRRLDQDKQVG